MILQRLVLLLLPVTSIYGRAVDVKPALEDFGPHHGPGSSADNQARNEDFNISPEILGEEAAKTQEGKVRIARFQSFMKKLGDKWPKSGVYLNKKHQEHECFFIHYPFSQIDAAETEVKILAKSLRHMSAGQTYSTDDSVTDVTTTSRVTTLETSNSKTTVSSWERGGEFGFGPLTSWLGLSIDINGKHVTEDTSVTDSSTKQSTENSKEHSVLLKKGRTVICPKNHICDLQLWTYQATVSGVAPAVLAVDFKCAHQSKLDGKQSAIGNQDWQVPELTAAALKDFDGKAELSIIPDLGVFPGRYKDFWAWRGVIARDFYRWTPSGSASLGFAQQSWLAHNDMFRYNPEKFDFTIDYLQDSKLSWSFPVLSPKSTLQTATILVKTPISAAAKRSVEDETIIEIIDEDVDLNVDDYSFIFWIF